MDNAGIMDDVPVFNGILNASFNMQGVLKTFLSKYKLCELVHVIS